MARKKRSIFETFPWQVIDKSRQSHHPLWFRSYDDLKSFYKNHKSMCKDAENLRIVTTDDNGNETRRFAFEV